MSLLDSDRTDKRLKGIIGLICGSKVSLNDIFGDSVQSEEPLKISLLKNLMTKFAQK